MAELPKAPRPTENNFGTFAVAGCDNFASRLAPEQRLKVLGWFQACPNPAAIAAQFDQEWTINRYLHCNFWQAWIIEQARNLNPHLAKKLLNHLRRPETEKPTDYDPRSVPQDYETVVSPGTTPWGYALSRVLIEETGRDWQIGDERVKRAQRLLKRSLQETSDPATLLAILADKVTKAEADPIKVLGHVFAVELEQEGVMFLVQKVADKVKEKAPELWQKYLQLNPDQRLAAGIIPSLT